MGYISNVFQWQFRLYSVTVGNPYKSDLFLPLFRHWYGQLKPPAKCTASKKVPVLFPHGALRRSFGKKKNVEKRLNTSKHNLTQINRLTVDKNTICLARLLSVVCIVTVLSALANVNEIR